jgi:hypothetical protein
MKLELLDLKSVPGETSEILSIQGTKKHELEHKVIGLCVNKCNTNSGRVKTGEMKTMCTVK